MALLSIRFPQARTAREHHVTSSVGRHGADPRVPLVIYAAGFVVFLVFALAASLLVRDWRAWLPGAERETSLVGGVRSAVYTFMSYLT